MNVDFESKIKQFMV